MAPDTEYLTQNEAYVVIDKAMGLITEMGKMPSPYRQNQRLAEIIMMIHRDGFERGWHRSEGNVELKKLMDAVTAAPPEWALARLSQALVGANDVTAMRASIDSAALHAARDFHTQLLETGTKLIEERNGNLH